MLIGFASNNTKGTNTCSVYEHMRELVQPSQTSCLHLLPQPENKSQYDIVIADSLNDFKKLKIKKKDKSLLAVFDGPSECFTANICLAASKAHKKRLIEKYDWTQETVFVVGQPSMDLLWATDNEQEAIKRIFLRSSLVNTDWSSILLSSVNLELKSKLMDHLIKFTEKQSMNLIVRSTDLFEVPDDCDHVCCSSINENPDNLPPLIAADVMVTDCADEALDYLALNRPIIFISSAKQITYPWWYNEDNLPGPIVRTVKQLCSLIETKDGWVDKYTAQRKLWKNRFTAGNGVASESVVNVLMKEFNRIQ
jgi:hypothetical protein